GVCVVRGDLGGGQDGVGAGIRGGPGGGGVHSPTFTLVNLYDTPRGPVRHWDLYRLGKGTDWSVLDLVEDVERAEGWTVVEWPERYPGPWPAGAWRLSIGRGGRRPPAAGVGRGELIHHEAREDHEGFWKLGDRGKPG
ncbi:MAG: tRNA (adenosine(37)-N6)-threonylcarbamoyltransferase complex ATPase subunit type 1 TsaE, partial [Bdellovibrionaceae bacterium]|nr:tRNA (adenosine(37)-N6)-threonylcarbamoyltransferase complex ATPase subunit type 1 TsaE [Pseudobdellovibrionaceae bacterium]